MGSYWLNVWELKGHMLRKQNIWQIEKNLFLIFQKVKNGITLFPKPQLARLICLNSIAMFRYLLIAQLTKFFTLGMCLFHTFCKCNWLKVKKIPLLFMNILYYLSKLLNLHFRPLPLSSAQYCTRFGPLYWLWPIPEMLMIVISTLHDLFDVAHVRDIYRELVISGGFIVW
jgi:hypothetical protein